MAGNDRPGTNLGNDRPRPFVAVKITVAPSERRVAPPATRAGAAACSGYGRGPGGVGQSLGGVGVHLPHGPPASRNQVKGELGPEQWLTRCITPYARDATAAALEMLRDPSRTARVLEKRAGFSRRAQSAAERSV